MSQTISVFDNIKLNYVSLLDFDEFYKKILKWFELKGYEAREVEYRDMDDPRGKNIEIIWEATKNNDHYSRFTLRIEIMVLGLQKVEAEKDGMKIKTNKANFTLKMDAIVTLDYSDQFNEGFKKYLREIYDRYLVKDRIDNYKKDMEADFNEMVNEIKSFFAMFGATVQ